MRGEEVILLNFPISHFLKSLAHSAVIQCIGSEFEAEWQGSETRFSILQNIKL